MNLGDLFLGIHLEQSIRRALYPDSPTLLWNYLLFIEETNDWTASQRAFHLLMTTIRDDTIPGQWRRLCLDNIYKPLVQMRGLKTCDDDEQNLRRCESALRELNI